MDNLIITTEFCLEAVNACCVVHDQVEIFPSLVLLKLFAVLRRATWTNRM